MAAGRLGWADAVAGAPSYVGRALRQLMSPLVGGATAARPLGAISGVRPGTLGSIVTATSTVWTVTPFAGVIDLEAAAIAGPYPFAFDTNQTGSVTAAGAGARIDILYVRVSDPAEGDGTAAPLIEVLYLAGAAGSGAAPATPARSFVIAQINVPTSGGGSPTVTWVAPYAVSAGGVLPAPTQAFLNTLGGYEGQVAMVVADTARNNGILMRLGGVWDQQTGDSGWITPTLLLSWTAANAISYRYFNGVVFLRGRASGGTTGTAFTLPAGFRPGGNRWHMALNGSATSGVTAVIGVLVDASGNVILTTGTTPNLDSISFIQEA